MVQYAIQLTLMRSLPTDASLPPRDRKLLADFPLDPRPVEKEFDLDPETVIYAVCPDAACRATYGPRFEGDSAIPIYPSRCRCRKNGRRCRQQLLRPKIIQDHVVYTPIEPFVYFSPTHWFGRFLSRPGVEAGMDSTWNRDKGPSKENPGFMYDIFDAEMLRDFKGIDGKHFSKGNGEGRYIFSLSLDFFNPLGNKQAGKKAAVGVISLVCLNLSPELRYKSENIFIAGIIPGPNKPPLTALNHFLAPLVDDFLKLWDPGVFFTRTDGHPHGRLVRCAIVCVVCDLPAARKTTGFVSSAHNHFCAICHCTRKENGYGNFDYSSWRRRNNWECRKSAKQFKRAGLGLKGEALVKDTGVRWSQLLRLPYFDPTRFVVVDTMHNLFLGLINEHFRTILGIELNKDTDKTIPVVHITFTEASMSLSKNEQTTMKKITHWLSQPMSAALNTPEGFKTWLDRFSKQHHSVLALIASELGCKPIPSHQNKTSHWTRLDYARGILDWVSTICISFVTALTAATATYPDRGRERRRHWHKTRACAHAERNGYNHFSRPLNSIS